MWCKVCSHPHSPRSDCPYPPHPLPLLASSAYPRSGAGADQPIELLPNQAAVTLEMRDDRSAYALFKAALVAHLHMISSLSSSELWFACPPSLVLQIPPDPKAIPLFVTGNVSGCFGLPGSSPARRHADIAC